MVIVVYLLLSLYICAGTSAQRNIGASTPRAFEPCAYTTPAVTTPGFAHDIQYVTLQHGPSHCSGLLMLHLSFPRNVSVCSQGFSRSEAEVVCKELRCGSVHSIVDGKFFANLTLKMWDHAVKCRNNETELKKCHKVAETCQSVGSVGIVCSDGHHDLSLQSNADRCHGNLLLYYKSSWHGVYGLILPDDAEGICKKLDCGHAVKVEENSVTTVSKVLVTNWTCLLTKMNISQCVTEDGLPRVGHKPIKLHCSRSELKVFRLVDGRSSCVGLLEVFHRGSWKPVCGNQSPGEFRESVCRQQECDSAGPGWKGPGPRGKNWTLSTQCVECMNQGLKSLVDQQTLWDCKEIRKSFKQINISCPGTEGCASSSGSLREVQQDEMLLGGMVMSLPRTRRPLEHHFSSFAEQPEQKKMDPERFRNYQLPPQKEGGGLSGGVTACIVLVVILILLLLLSYGWKLYKRNGKQVFRRKQTQRQWIGPTGAVSHAVSFHRNNNANMRPASSQSAMSNVCTGAPQKDTLSAYPALERRANTTFNLPGHSSDSDYDFFDTHCQRL
ncbi:scavenger receptor cysteine-rich type 1 protein M130-like [Stegostoma tigrinum]|uniref:scavenger receptor cysteine-rich type 1 protein M130-like n=1 Tax=Stegostoma tigrinum TaxID=3053191 RepID=UPI0028700F1E|nr:scavenger receptor cysteine-rich type 1 protein M130-like [Stegostoma tigrinum]